MYERLKLVLNIINLKKDIIWKKIKGKKLCVKTSYSWEKRLCLSMTSNDDQKFRATDF
jgi:hypothetical protein